MEKIFVPLVIITIALYSIKLNETRDERDELKSKIEKCGCNN